MERVTRDVRAARSRTRRGRHHVQRQQHPVHHHQREPRSHQLAPHPREDHQPSRTAPETDRQIFGRQPADPGEVRLVVAALPHHLLRQVGAAQVALLLPLRAAPRHHGLYRAGIHRLPLVEARRAGPASGSDWPRRPPTSWEPRPRRCWDGSNTCVRRMWTRRPSRR